MMTATKASTTTRPAITPPRIFDRPSTLSTLPKAGRFVERSAMRVFLDQVNRALPGILGVPVIP